MIAVAATHRARHAVPFWEKDQEAVALKLTQRQVQGIEVIEAEGRIALGQESNALRQKVRELVGAGKRKLVVNLKGVDYIDSAGLGTLVAAFQSVASQGGAFKIANPDRNIRNILDLNKLTTVLEVCDREEDAIAGPWPAQE